MKRNLILLLLVVFSIPVMESCKQSIATSSRNADEPEVPVQAVTEYPQMLAVLYQQTAAEYRALCYQAFNVAKYRLDQLVKEAHGSNRLSVVVDLDETMIDNSPYEARCILEDLHYPEGWEKWVNESSAKAVPGALDFLVYARNKGIEVFYISNRDEMYKNVTLQNLQKLNFPFAQPDHILLKREDDSKKTRRDFVQSKTEIIMLIGDNMVDFSEAFENKGIKERFEITDRFSDQFGNKFIVLPNAIYGDWLDAVYENQSNLTSEKKADYRKNTLITK